MGISRRFYGAALVVIIVITQEMATHRTDNICVGSGPTPHPKDCSKYVVCDNGRFSVRKCPAGMRFNPHHHVCDFAYNVKCNSGTSTEGNSQNSFTQGRNYAAKLPTSSRSHDINEYVPYVDSTADKQAGIDVSEYSDNYFKEDAISGARPSFGQENGNKINSAQGLSVSYGEHTGSQWQEYGNQVPERVSSRGSGHKNGACHKDGFFPHPGDCRQFKQCAVGRAYIIPCPTGTYFDPGTKVCGHSASGCTIVLKIKALDRESKLTFGGESGPTTYNGRFSSGTREDDIRNGYDIQNPQVRARTQNRKNRNEYSSNNRGDFQPQPVPQYKPTLHRNIRQQRPKRPGVNSQEFVNRPSPAVSQPGRVPPLEQVRRPDGTSYESYTNVPASEDPVQFTTVEEMMIAVQRFIDNEIPLLKDRVKNMLKEEAIRAKSIKPRRSAFSAVQNILGSTTYVKQLSISAFLQLQCTKMIKRRFRLNKFGTGLVMRRFGSILRKQRRRHHPHSRPPTPGPDFCPFADNTEDNDCDPQARYRTIDGSCNNLKRPLWGKSYRPLARFLQPDYSDGIEDVRKSKNGKLLPSARLISTELFVEEENLDPVRTVMHMTFGQLLDHDIGRTAVTKLATNESGTGMLVDVLCGDSGCETAGIENRACFPIPVPEGDPDFRGQECLQFVRTQEVLRDDCSLAPREQLNQLTSWLDGSLVYGSTEAEAEALRDRSYPNRGRLKVSPNLDPTKKVLLPQKFNTGCRDVNETIECFTAGDGRANEQVGLAATHVILLRLHNDIEEKLFILNPHWDGERLYMETRKILAALWQHIVYNEYVTSVLGPGQIKKYGLELLKSGYFEGYDPKVNGDATNSFQTAAFRFGHSQITNLLRFSDQKFKRFDELQFSTVFRRPFEVYNNARQGGSGVDSVTLGMISQPTEATDSFFSRQVTGLLFSEKPPSLPGTDLPAINIQRGREHGLPGYNEWRKWCGLKPAQSFDDLVDIPEKIRRKFKQIYDYVDDIDLFPGGVAEVHVPGGVVGPTFACIIARQFRNLRVGDRFWYERNDPLIGFTQDQLTEIRKITLSKVVCQTLDKVKTIQKFVMIQPFSEAFKNLGPRFFSEAYSIASLYRGERNERRPCSQLEDVDLTKWRENRPGYHQTVFTI